MGAFFSSFGGETTTPPPKAKAAAKSKKVAKKATVQKSAKKPARVSGTTKAKVRDKDPEAPPPAADAESVHLEFIGANSDNNSGQSSKFWEMTLSGRHTYVTNGKIGSGGQTQDPVAHADGAAARKFFEKTVKSKLKKGYLRGYQPV